MATISHITLPDNTDYSIQATGIFFGQVDSTSTSTVYTATIPGITEYYDGLTILLKNGIVTSASGFTININDLGAKPSYSNMTTGNDITPTAPTRDTTIFNINYTMLFVYDSTLVEGGAWICYRGYDANTNTIGYQLRTNSYTLKTYDKFRYYRILFTSADDTHWVPANNGTDNSATSTKTVNQRPINPFGSIVYCGNSTNYAAEANITATAIWQQYTLTLGYSFNRTGAALILTTQRPVFIKCAPQSDGSAIIDSTTPYVQTLPSTDDGKIYIFLGIAYSATMVEMTLNHPVYYYKDGAIRLWTNASTVSVPTASDANPQMDGTAAAGTSNNYSRADHVHPSDTSRMAANLKGVANGVAELDANGRVPSSQLPSYVDDVIEGYYYNSKFYEESSHTTEISGETGKIYVDLSTEKTYRWSGTAFVEISASLALGETSSTAYRGDRGKTAYDHSQLTSGNPHNVSKSDIGLGNVDNVQQYSVSNPPPYPVTSVNGNTGAVSLSIPTKTSDLTNDSGYTTNVGTITGVTAGSGLSGGGSSGSVTLNHSNSVTAQTTQALYPIKIDAQGHISEYGTAVTSLPASDVSAWAKAATKPTYTASEVGALPDTTTIPSKTSDLANDSGFITGMTILSYGNSTWNDFINAYDANKVVYCRASSNSNPASGSQTRLAFMAYVNNATTPTEVEFQYYRSVSTHTESQQGDQVYVYKLNKNNGWSVTVREASIKVAYNNGITGTYSNGVMTLKHANSAITAQSTQAVYPIAIDAYGHITGYGSAVTIPEIPSVTVSDNGKILTVVNGAWAAADLPTYQGGVS